MPTESNPPETAQPDAWIERLKEAGFRVEAQDGSRFRVSKHGCAAVVVQSQASGPHFAVRPGLLVRAATVSERTNDLRPEQETSEHIAHLVDRGFQKFWQDGDRRVPALAAQL